MAASVAEVSAYAATLAGATPGWLGPHPPDLAAPPRRLPRPQYGGTAGPGAGARRRTFTRRDAARMLVAALGLGLLMNAGAMEQSARTDPYGTRRTVALAVLHPIAAVARALWLDRPRAELEALAGHGTATSGLSSGHVDTSDGAPTTAGALAPVNTGVIHRIPPSAYGPLPARIPTPTDPLRLWVGGDSVAGFFGYGMDDIAGATGVVSAHSHYKISTGLSRPDYYDWPAHLEEDMRTYDPEVVVFLVGANDDQPLQLPAGGIAEFGSDAWRAEYGRRVDSVMTSLEREGRTVVWMGLPVMRNPDFDARMRVIDDIDRAAAARHTHVTFFDSRPVLATSAGGYDAWLPDPGGGETQVRADDGIHLTPAGGRRLAQVVLDAVLQQLATVGEPAVRGVG